MIPENKSRAKLYSNKVVLLCVNTSAPLLLHAGSGSAPCGAQSFLFTQVLCKLGWVLYENVIPQDFQGPWKEKKKHLEN